MKRRGNGEGTIRKRADGRWEARFPVADGVKSLYGKTRKEVAAAARDFQAAEARGRVASGPGDTLERLTTLWLAHVRQNREPETYRSYASRVRKYILPDLGQERLDRLTPSRIQAWLTRLSRTDLAPSSVAHVRTVLVAALAYGERLELLDRNPASLVQGPTVPRREHTALTLDEAKAILKAIAGHRLEAAYQLGLLLGLRRGEIFGLTWDCLGDGELAVRQQLQHQGDRWVLKPTKGKRARTMGISLRLRDAIIFTRRDREQLEMELAGPRWHHEYDDWGLVFRTTIGTPIEGRWALDSFRRLLNNADLPPMRLHDLRHNCASLLFAQGVPARLVMEILGHANIGMTMDTYTHVLPSMTREALTTLEEQLHRKEAQ